MGGDFVLCDYYLLICFYLFFLVGSARWAANHEEQCGIGGDFVSFDYYLLICFYLFSFFGSALRASNHEVEREIVAIFVFLILFTHLFLPFSPLVQHQGQPAM